MHMFRSWVLPFIGFLFYRLLSLTWRQVLIESEEMQHALKDKRLIILSHWHGDELALISIVGHYKICTMVSTSKDGEIMNRVLTWLGGATSRGSSTRGGVAALRGLLRNVRLGFRPSVAVDGPKGPIYKVKPGVFEISKVLQAEVYPVGVAVSSCWVFSKSWNKAYLPKPFARVVFSWGAPVPLLTKDQDPRDPNLALQLEEQLNKSKLSAQNHLCSIAGPRPLSSPKVINT